MALSPVHGAPAPQRTPEQAAPTLSGGEAGAFAAAAGTGAEAADILAEHGRHPAGPGQG